MPTKRSSKNLIIPKKKMVAIPEADDQDRYCFFCAKHKSLNSFYMNADPRLQSHLCPICKTCAKELAERYQFGEPRGATKDSIKTVLRFMNKPFVDRIYESAKKKVLDQTNPGESLWGAYIGILQRDKEYKDAPWELGDDVGFAIAENDVEYNQAQIENNEEVMLQLRINQQDVVRLIGYDPFENEPIEDKPLLYAQTVGFLDSSPDVAEDQMKLSSIVEIVKLFNQTEKINQAITELSKTKQMVADNISTIKALQSTKKDTMNTAMNLAKENAISVLHNTNKSKGSGTFAGMSKKLNEMNLREHHVNSFDVETASGMEQVANLSHRAILDQINLNENDWPDMIADQRRIIMQWKKIAADAAEQARILIQENADLKRILELYNSDELTDNSEEMNIDGGVNADEVVAEGFIEEMARVSTDILVDEIAEFEENE